MIPREPKRSCMAGRMAAMAMVALIVWATPSTIAWAAEDTTSCLSATDKPAVAPCRRELLRDPGNLEIRFALSDALMGLRRYADAVAVLQQGLENFLRRRHDQKEKASPPIEMAGIQPRQYSNRPEVPGITHYREKCSLWFIN